MDPGERRAFEQLIADTQHHLRCVIAGMGLRGGEVDDLAQETYLVHLREPGRMPDGVELPRWLAGIARNLCREHVRRQARRGETLLEIADLLAARAACDDEPDAGADDDELRRLRGCLDRLDHGQRQLLHCFYQDEETSETLGARLGLSAVGVRKRLLRLRQALAACMRQRPPGTLA